MMQPVKVGVAVLVRRGDSVLMGIRKGSHGKGTWAPPGGHLENGETIAHAASRELAEETGLVIHPVLFKPIGYTNDVFEEGVHYVTLYVEADWIGGEAEALEPDKCAEWLWLNQQPEGELFLPLRHFVEQYPGVIW